MTEKVDHPQHYNSHPSGVEAIDIVQYMGFCLGNAFKYVYRYQHKNGTEDLKKAIWYLRHQQTVILKQHIAATHTAINDYHRIITAEQNKDIVRVLEIIWDVSFNDHNKKELEEAAKILEKFVT
tara:strand:- start:222 stop:593 length:372 start_codon:yes stop_codon:yes gene_type:complete